MLIFTCKVTFPSLIILKGSLHGKIKIVGSAIAFGTIVTVISTLCQGQVHMQKFDKK